MTDHNPAMTAEHEAIGICQQECYRAVYAHDKTAAIDHAFNRLRAALASRAPDSEWQPIESAPKDGTHVLVQFNDLRTPLTVVHWFEDGWYLSVSLFDQPKVEPILWQPLPAFDFSFGRKTAAPSNKADAPSPTPSQSAPAGEGAEYQPVVDNRDNFRRECRNEKGEVIEWVTLESIEQLIKHGKKIEPWGFFPPLKTAQQEPAAVGAEVEEFLKRQEAIAKRVSFKHPLICNQCLDWNTLVTELIDRLHQQAGRDEVLELSAKAVEDAGGDNADYHATAVRALKTAADKGE